LAMERRPDLVLVDDRAGIAAAHAHGFVVTGTLTRFWTVSLIPDPACP
jgi:predicted nucleic acid-binding protein